MYNVFLRNKAFTNKVFKFTRKPPIFKNTVFLGDNNSKVFETDNGVLFKSVTTT